MKMLKLAVISWLLCTISNGESLDSAMDQAILKLASGLAPDSLQLPVLSVAPVPPPEVQAAGKDFIRAWQIWERVMTQPPQDGAGAMPVPKDKVINAAQDWGSFSDLLHRCIVDDPPPDSSEFSRFSYDDRSFCADGFMSFDRTVGKGTTLLLLRHGKYLDTLRHMDSGALGAEGSVLRAFGVNPEEFRIGAWMDQESITEMLCGSGGELTARMVMDWIDLRWDIELDRYKKAIATRTHPVFREPDFPKYEIVKLLRPDNGVTDETKSRIASFINSRGLEIGSGKRWMQNCPRGAEKWLVDMARRGLTDDLNSVRQECAAFLDRAGVPYPKPEMKAGPRFSVTLDGEPWPGKLRGEQFTGEQIRLDLYSSGEANWGGNLTRGPDGIYNSNPDDFNEKKGMGTLTRVEINSYPTDFGGKPIAPVSPWLHGSARLPLSSTEVNQITIETTAFTIRPVFAGQLPPAADDLYDVEFDRATGEKNEPVPNGGRCRLQVKGSQPLVLSTVSPGEYWVRIDCPGAVAVQRRKITVSSSQPSYEPLLERGSSIVVPVDWKELNDPDHLPLKLGFSFSRQDDERNNRLRNLCVLKRKDGTVIEQFGKPTMADGSLSPVPIPSPVAAGHTYHNAAVFPCLPPGEYVVESPDREIKSEPGDPGCVFKKSSVSVSIRSDSPRFVKTEPLKILYQADGQ